MENSHSTKQASVETPPLKAETFPTPAHPVPRFLSKKGAFLSLFFILVLLIAVSISTVMDLQKQDQKSSVVSPTQSTTTNWKTYTSTKYGYSIKYPLDWLVRECPVSPDCSPTDETTYINSQENIGSKTEPIQYFLYISSYTDDLPKEYTFTQELINNKTVLRTADFPSRSGAETVLFKRNDRDYISIGFTPYDNKGPFPQQEKFYKTFNQILQTFRFLE